MHSIHLPVHLGGFLFLIIFRSSWYPSHFIFGNRLPLSPDPGLPPSQAPAGQQVPFGARPAFLARGDAGPRGAAGCVGRGLQGSAGRGRRGGCGVAGVAAAEEQVTGLPGPGRERGPRAGGSETGSFGRAWDAPGRQGWRRGDLGAQAHPEARPGRTARGGRHAVHLKMPLVPQKQGREQEHRVALQSRSLSASHRGWLRQSPWSPVREEWGLSQDPWPGLRSPRSGHFFFPGHSEVHPPPQPAWIT